MKIIWSVDSLGNGRFIEPLSVKKANAFQKREYLIKCPEYMSTALKSQGDRFSFYDIKGRKFLNVKNCKI